MSGHLDAVDTSVVVPCVSVWLSTYVPEYIDSGLNTSSTFMCESALFELSTV